MKKISVFCLLFIVLVFSYGCSSDHSILNQIDGDKVLQTEALEEKTKGDTKLTLSIAINSNSVPSDDQLINTGRHLASYYNCNNNFINFYFHSKDFPQKPFATYSYYRENNTEKLNKYPSRYPGQE